MVRPKRNENTKDVGSGFAMFTRAKSPDLSEHVLLRTFGKDHEIDEYVHKDDYEHYSKFVEKP